MSPGQPFLELSGLTKSFGETRVLEDVSLTVERGELVALLGPSGSGKTTVLRLLAGFEEPDDGEIAVAGRSVRGLSPEKREVGMVFQHYALFPHMSVAENVAFGLEARRWKRPRVDARVEELLSLVGLAGLGRRRVGEISGGQQQRVALARALAPEPRLLLLDEPLSNLDPSLRERTRRQLRRTVERIGITTLLVTHEQEEGFVLGDRVALLNGGRLEQVGRPEELYEAPVSRFTASFVGRSTTLPGRIESCREGAAVVLLTVRGPEPVRWRATAREALADGEEVDLVCRPEALTTRRTRDTGALEGRVVERRFTGPATYLTVRTGDGLDVEVRAAGWEAPDQKVAVAPVRDGPQPWVFRREPPG